MTDKTTSFANPTGEHSTTVGEKLSSSAGQVKDKLSDLGRTAVDTIDENRSAAASGLDKAASALHDTAGSLPGGEKVSHMAHAAADRLSSTAGYVRAHDVNRMMADVETLVKNSPGPSLLVAAAIGFLVGRAFND
jgi:ElaB/YqjD/DUF883 family membrane-anchored ribosome-binding protein